MHAIPARLPSPSSCSHSARRRILAFPAGPASILPVACNKAYGPVDARPAISGYPRPFFFCGAVSAPYVPAIRPVAPIEA